MITSQLVLSSNTTGSVVPVILLLAPSTIISCSAGFSPCIAFGNQVEIDCGPNEELKNTNGCTIETSSASQTLLGPGHSGANTDDLHIRGLTIWNQSASATATVVDLTNTSFVTIENSGIGHDGGTGDVLHVEAGSSTLAAYHDSLVNSFVYGGGGGNSIRITNGGNEFNVFGSVISDSGCALNVDNSTSNPGGTDGVHLYGTDAEGYADAALCIKPSTGGVYGVVWSGGRFESNTGAVTDISTANGTVSQIYMIGPNINGTNTGRQSGDTATTWLFTGGGYNLPDGITTTKTVGVGGVNQLSSNGNLAGRVSLTGGSATITFNPAFTNIPACTASDTQGANAVKASASTSSLVLTGTSGDEAAYICVGNPN